MEHGTTRKGLTAKKIQLITKQKKAKKNRCFNVNQLW